MHEEFATLSTLAILLGGLAVLVVVFGWGLLRHRRERRSAMRRGNQIYYEWLKSSPPRDRETTS